MTDWAPLRPFQEWDPQNPTAFDPRQGTFIPDRSVTASKIASVDPRTVDVIGVKVYNSATQTVTTGTDTAVTWDTSVFQQGDFWTVGTPTKFFFPYSGIYRVDAYAEFVSDTTNNLRKGWLVVDGATKYTVNNRAPRAGGNPTSLPVGAVIKATGGSYVEMYVRHDKGADLNLNSAEDNSNMTVIYLGTI